MNIVSRPIGKVMVLYLKGDINIDSSNFIETVAYHLENGMIDILCDFSEINMVDYTGLSVLAIAYKNVINHHGRMKFVNVPVHIRNIFSSVCIDRLFEIYESTEVALNSFKEDRIIEEIKRKKLRRRFKRLPILIPVKFRLKDNPEERIQRGKICNLSAIGAYILCKKTYGLGDILTLDMPILPKSGSLIIDARVIWLANKEFMPQLYPGMGVEFFNIPNDTQLQIIQFVEKNLPLGSIKE
jgi:anti-sigma B factor antagonist